MVNAPPSIEERLRSWKSHLHNLTDLLVPTDYPRPLPLRTVEEVQTYELSERTLMSVLQLSMGNGSPKHPTAFSILLAAFAVLLQRYTGDEEFAVGSSSPTQNALVLKLKVDPLQTFNEVVQMVQKVSHPELLPCPPSWINVVGWVLGGS